MFQSFDVTSNAGDAPPRVAALREQLAELGIDAFIVPRADEHQNEYVPARAMRLAWLTSFTGSAGAALILQDKALLFVDGRYTEQARSQTDPNTFQIVSSIVTPLPEWIRGNCTGLSIGFDPWLHTVSDVEKLTAACRDCGATPVRCDWNPIDAIWPDQPSPPLEPVGIHRFEHAGMLAREKLALIAEQVRAKKADALLMTDPASMAWAFNIRGADVAHIPLALAFAIVPADGLPDLFIDKRKLAIEPEAYLTQIANLKPPSSFEKAVAALGGTFAKVMLDADLAADRLREIVENAGGTVVRATDPVAIPRARKNAAELDGARAAHLRDGIAMARFLHWLDRQAPGAVDEIGAAVELERQRRAVGDRFSMPLLEISFPTISASGPNAALPHYRVDERSNRMIGRDEIYLVDSGGQYRDGTTDITRSVAIGQPPEPVRRHFTLVLKGMIAIATARFPKGTRGIDLDPFARRALWQAGHDFSHGTGHGVGSYLSVHEGPQSISRRGMQELLPGMILSDEPGFYAPGSHGIRIENLVVVTEAASIEGGTTPMLGFETLTLCPIDRRLVVADMLSGDEVVWLDTYHARVRDALTPHLEQETAAWLEAATAPLQG